VVDVRVRGQATVDHAPHDGQERAAGAEQRYPLVGDVQATGLDPAPQVSLGKGGERGQHHAVRDLHADEQPGPVGIAARAADELAVRRGDHLGGVIEVPGHGVDGLALRGDRLGEDRFDDRFLAVEVVVERAEADVGHVGDLVYPRGVDALTGEQPPCRLDQLAPRLLAAAGMPIGRRSCHWSEPIERHGADSVGVRPISRSRILPVGPIVSPPTSQTCRGHS
jgi:hypothetical protein